MNPEHLQQLNHIDNRVDEIETRFDRHLEIYANNGKEMSKLADCIKSLSKDFKEFREVNEPYLKVLQDLAGSKRVFFWVVSSLASIGAVYLMLKEIIKR